MKNYSIFIGIDVSKAKLDIHGIDLNADTVVPHCIIENKAKVIQKWIQSIFKKFSKETVLFCFENTGIYSMPLCIEFTEVKANYWQVPAIEISRSIAIKRGKSDKIDAQQIALFALKNKFQVKQTQLAAKSIQKLRLLYAEREKLVQAHRQFVGSQEVNGFFQKEVTKELLACNKKTLQFITKQIKHIEQLIEDIIKEEAQLANQYKLVQSVPGIGKQTALYLLLITQGFTCFKNARQLSCYGGMAPFEYSSGSRVRGKTKVNHLANKKLKALLNMCAMSAKKHDPEIQAYYDRKKQEGKHELLIRNNIKNKLLGRVFAVINRGTPFVNTHKFAA